MPDQYTSRVFISYARSDGDFVDRLESDLHARHIDTWVDRHQLAGGQQWNAKIREAIARCDVFLLVLSPDAVASASVRREYVYALQRNKPLIPLLYYPIPHLPRRLRGHQWLSFQAGVNFDATYSAALANLLNAIDLRGTLTPDISRLTTSETSVALDHDLAVTTLRGTLSSAASPLAESTDLSSDEQALATLRLTVTNTGRGPLDVLGVLVAGRVLSPTYAPGTRAAAAEWSDYQPLYWNEPHAHALFAGISTTSTLLPPGPALRVEAREHLELQRVDGVQNIDALRQQQTAHLRYQVFLVARDYRLGEILRQLGGGASDRAPRVRRELQQLQRLAQPNHRRWLCVQQALINLDRLAFRLALYDPANPYAGSDPLGMLATPNAWRIFLLHHWEFVDDIPDAAPARLPRRLKEQYRLPPGALERATERARDHFPHLRLPVEWDDAVRARIAQASEACRRELAPMIAAWARLCAAISACQANTFAGRVPRGCPNDGFPRMIHLLPEYRERWFALMQEGYLISKMPSPPRFRLGPFVIGWWRRQLLRSDIPADPRVLEPFTVRPYEFSEELRLPS